MTSAKDIRKIKRDVFFLRHRVVCTGKVASFTEHINYNNKNDYNTTEISEMGHVL